METNTKQGVYSLVYQDRWDKTRILIADLQDMEAKGRYGIDKDSMDYINGFLIYLAWK